MKYHLVLVLTVKLNQKTSEEVQSISLILSEKFYHFLFRLPCNYFTQNQKFFIFSYSLGPSLSNGILFDLHFSCFHSDIIGLRIVIASGRIR